MARSVLLKFLRTSRAALNSAAAANNLTLGEPYLITDDGRLAIGTGTDTYSAAALQSELSSKADAGAAANFLQTVISANSTSPALRVSQAGTGDVILIEDVANPDASPFLVNTSGYVVIGHTTTLPTGVGTTGQKLAIASNTADAGLGLQIARYRATASLGADLELVKSASSTVGENTAVASGHLIGAVTFAAADGTTLVQAARVLAEVDGTPGTGDMPGRLRFMTTPDGSATPAERMRIDSLGNVGIGATAAARLHVMSTTEPLRLGYDATNYATFTVSSAGVLSIAPTGSIAIDKPIVFSDEIRETPVVANTGTAYTVNIAAGTLFDLTLTGTPVVFIFPAPTAGRQFTLLLKQDATGTRLVTPWPTSVRWPDDTAPTLTTTPGRTDMVSFFAEGNYWLGSVGGLNWNRA